MRNIFEALFNLIMKPVDITSGWSKQRIFDEVAKHLFAQGVRCSEGDQCLYRGPNGTKCAVGVLIPDAMYDERMEIKDVFRLFDAFPEVAKFLGRDNKYLLKGLQRVHDDDFSWTSESILRSKLKDVAYEFSLDWSLVNGLSFNGK